MLERTPRRVILSVLGLAFRDSAQLLLASCQQAMLSFDAPKRTLEIGASHHIVGADLPRWLKRLTATDLDVVVAFSLGTSRKLLERYERDTLDVALILRHGNRRKDGDIIGTEQFTWMAGESFFCAARCAVILGNRACALWCA